MTLSPSREWDSAAYDRISAPQFSWGKRVLERISLAGDERLLDGGCGTGRLTGELLALLPKGHVVGVDLSQNMLSAARANLQPGFPARITFVAADLAHLPFERAFDGIFSTATFHWVQDHDLLFLSLYRALRPGGWLVAQSGGGPNLSRFLARVDELAQTPKYRTYVGAYRHRWTFADPEETAKRLKCAGFQNIETSLEQAPTRFREEGEFSEFVSKVILRHFLEHLPKQSIRQQFMADVSCQAGKGDSPYELDYWRLNLEARRPA